MYTIAALYHFTRLDSLSDIQKALKDACLQHGITGTLLIAHEGINGTIAGSARDIDQILAHIRSLPGCSDLVWKISNSETQPFRRMKVRLKREIVTMGKPDVDPNASVGTYIEPENWNDLITSEDVAVIDTRNDYEVAIGTFEGAVDPKTKTFREFPKWWEENQHRFHNKRIAMFCTGGIRCEKSTNYLLSQGVEEVFHLKGGILKYLEEVPEKTSQWNGECFVFDGRVSVGHGLEVGPHQLCHACRRPIMPEDVKRSEYEVGVACHNCAHETSDEDKARFRERQKQIDLAKKRGSDHLA